jgi:ribosomal protein S27AE
MIQESEKLCPRCGLMKVKIWAELNDEQKMLVERLPGSAEFSRAERKKHRFCTRCWFEFSDREMGPITS